jgi:hypothetical protein
MFCNACAETDQATLTNYKQTNSGKCLLPLISEFVIVPSQIWGRRD